MHAVMVFLMRKVQPPTTPSSDGHWAGPCGSEPARECGMSATMMVT